MSMKNFPQRNVKSCYKRVFIFFSLQFFFLSVVSVIIQPSKIWYTFYFKENEKKKPKFPYNFLYFNNNNIAWKKFLLQTAHISEH